MKRRISSLTGNVAAEGLLTGTANRTTKVPITPKGGSWSIEVELACLLLYTRRAPVYPSMVSLHPAQECFRRPGRIFSRISPIAEMDSIQQEGQQVLITLVSTRKRDVCPTCFLHLFFELSSSPHQAQLRGLDPQTTSP